MADSPAFEWLCGRLETSTSLDRLEARGTVRLTLKQAGLEARSVGKQELAVIVEKLLPRELSARGIDDAEDVCRNLRAELAQADLGAGDLNTPDALFDRLEAS